MLALSAIEATSSVKGLGRALLTVAGRRPPDKAALAVARGGEGGARTGVRAIPPRPGVRLPRATRRTALLCAALALALPAPCRPLAGQAPDERWRSLETEHFTLTHPEGLEALALETAAHAERAWDRLEASFGRTPRGRIQLLLTDHMDVSNGFASVAPYPKVTIFARPPVEGFALSHFDDWLELVVTHELTHLFHLEAGGRFSRLLRGVFGNVPVGWPFYPQYTVPEWTVEGLATWYESHLTGEGRVAGAYHDMVIRTALLEDRFEDIDEASGSSPVWPGGSRSYIYGSLFFEYLLGAYGPERVEAFVEAVGGQWVPFRVNAAARKAFDVPFTAAWREWRAGYAREVEALSRKLGQLAPLTEPEAVTSGARLALYPRVSPDGGTLVYAVSDGRSDAQLRWSLPDGSAARPLGRTNGTASFGFLPNGDVVFAQLDFTDPYRIRSDLHRLSPDGEARRITEGGRLDQPAAAPDGRVLAVRHGDGTSWLVEVEVASGAVRAVTEPDPDVHWAFPQVSPDGRWIAATRWQGGGIADLVVLDRAGRVVVEVTRDRAVDAAPAWSPDGGWLLWGSERSGIPNLYAVPFDAGTGAAGEPRQVTNVLTGAAFPSVDPEGRWIHFSSYHADGWEIERIPFAPSAWFEPFPLDPRFGPVEEGGPALASGASPPALTTADARPYSALRTLLPRYWSPQGRGPVTASGREVLSSALGFSTSGEDVVGRHALEGALLFTLGSGEVEGYASYRWAGLGSPVVGLQATQFWDASGPFLGRRQDDSQERLWLLERERSLSTSLTFPLPGYRVSVNGTLSAGLVWEDRELLDDRLEPATGFVLTRPSSRLGDLRGVLSLSSARGHAFSLGAEEGASLLLQGRSRHELDIADSLSDRAGSDRSLNDLLARVRAFQSFDGPGFSDHVLALQATGGVSGGPGADAFHFDVGGASGERERLTGFGLFGGPGYLFGVRGYPNGVRSGRYAWAAALEYRFPLSLVHEGKGLLPLHLDRLGGTLFFDAGNAWGPELGVDDPRFDNPRADALASLGGELASEMLAFFRTDLTLRVGVAFPLVERDGPVVYLRLGRSF